TLDNFSVTRESLVTDGVTADFLRDLGKQEGIEEIGNIYVKEIDPVISEENYALIEERIFDNPKAQATMDWKFGDDPELLNFYREEHYMDGRVYGISEYVMNRLEKPEGELDWERFNSGDYVIAARFDTLEEEGIDFFLPGEKVTVYNEAGEGREYEVLAVAEMPYACGLQWFGTCDCDYFLPEGEYLDLMGEQQPMRTLFNAAPEQEAALDEWLSDYCENVDPALLYTSKAKIVEQFTEYRNLIALTGSLLAFILGLIGILNFINTIVTSVLSRKQEFAMMEAVGMTGGQLKRMLCFEGGYYALYTGIFSVVLSSLVSVLVVKPYGDEMFFFRWHFTLTPLGLCLPVLLAVVLLVPAVCHRRMNRVSVVERMRRS
ncbi:ABC transporter permease, partial [Sporofaciens musculi]|uniref:ABC transporter permease n=1 Tax=Sporofaciens musculi TaxID=2681861 RepID=UPI0025700E38